MNYPNETNELHAIEFLLRS